MLLFCLHGNRRVRLLGPGDRCGLCKDPAHPTPDGIQDMLQFSGTVGCKTMLQFSGALVPLSAPVFWSGSAPVFWSSALQFSGAGFCFSVAIFKSASAG